MAADKEGEGAAARGGRSVDEKRHCGLGLGCDCSLPVGLLRHGAQLKKLSVAAPAPAMPAKASSSARLSV